MKADKKFKIFYAQVLNPLSDTQCEYHQDAALILSQRKGKWVVKRICAAKEVDAKILAAAQVTDLSSKVIMPSFFDVHFHWVQDDVRTMPKASLLEWLDKYTFPAENKFRNKSYSQKKARFFFRRLIASGTLGGAIYSSIHEHALEHAQQEAVGHFAIGNVQMTMNSPKFLTQEVDEAIEISSRLAQKYGASYALTPRFAIATDPHTMRETAKVAKKTGSFIQTHLSENLGEIDFVMQIYKNLKGFERVKNYTEIYHKVGLLGPKTIMGHAIHMSDDELKLLAKTKTSIAHCPTSNAPIRQKGLGSGLFDYKKAEKHNVLWALASDIGGGPYLSMFDVMRSFVEQNRKTANQTTYTKALFRATLAGAKVMKADKLSGNLSVGKEANFIVVNAPRTKMNSAEQVIEAIVNKSKRKRSEYDDLAQAVYFQGECLFKR